jgi:hypothetical protein
MRFFSLLVSVFIFFSSTYASADRNNDFNLKNYVYDDEGVPLFIKLYIKASKTESSDRNKSVVPLFLAEESVQILNLMMQEDQLGSFLAIPIKKKKEKEDDESTWECPICGRTNPASRSTCQYSDCPLNRKGIREWGSFFSD